MRRFSVCMVLCLALCQSLWALSKPAQVVLVQEGKARCAIYVPAKYMAPDDVAVLSQGFGPAYVTELARIRVREAVNDLSRCFKVMSGATVPVYTRKPAAKDTGVAILVGDYAKDSFGLPKTTSPYKQAWRLVVAPTRIGFIGEADESTTYGIYEVLDRLGCRWYMPSDMGEVIPALRTIVLPVEDTSAVPRVISRKIWCTDRAFSRRNRLGGMQLEASHALEIYLTKEQLNAHPDWKAQINGVRGDNGRVCWANPEVADAIADAVIANIEKYHPDSASLSPDDGLPFCECDQCKALDAGDRDTTMDCVAITDRYIHFINQIAEKVATKYPDKPLGFYAYVHYTRPPVREKLHPNLVPVLAPITYCRAHPMTDKTCPSRSQLLPFVEGWGKASRHFGLYEYAYNLAEVMAPNPMITKWSTELPIFYKNHMDIWIPETMSNFDTSLPGLYLGIRMSWNPDRQPKAIMDELYPKFYGAAAGPMRRYWEFIDSVWINTPEHAGGGYGYGRFFTPQVMQQARALLDEALRAAKTPMEYRRVKLASDSFWMFEGYMRLRNRLFAGEYATSQECPWALDIDYNIWYGCGSEKAIEYQDQFAFCPRGSDHYVWGPHYVNGYWGQTYKDAARIASDYTILTRPPITTWRCRPDKEKTGEQVGWQAVGFDDSGWTKADISRDTWADLGIADYFGALWYRSTVKLPALVPGKKVYLWVSNFDTQCKLFVNGQPVKYLDEQGEAQEEANCYSTPFSYEITPAVKSDADNLIVIKGTRPFLNELGTGGLQGPVVIYQEK